MNMKYKYKNLKHVKLHGMEPFGEGVFNHKILGGGIELVEVIGEEKKNKNNYDSKKSLENK